MSTARNADWRLKSFLDSLIVELDKAQDTLAVKGLTRPLSYSVKEMAIDLYVFPYFDGRTVRFRTAQPGERGASKLTFDLGSITSQQIQRTTKDPLTFDDIPLERVDGLGEGLKQTLRKHGVETARDLERWQRRNVDLETVVESEAGEEDELPVGPEPAVRQDEEERITAPAAPRREASRARKPAARKAVSYDRLAQLINRARRQDLKPSVSNVALSHRTGRPVLSIRGENLALAQASEGFPAAVLAGHELEVLSATGRELRLGLVDEQLRELPGSLQVALDPYALITMELKG